MASKKQEKTFAAFNLGTATSIKQQQPRFMAAVKTEKEGSEHVIISKQKKWKIDKMVLATWIIVIALTIIIWYFILKLF